MASASCSVCRTPLDSQHGFVFCAQCGAPHFNGDLKSPFSVFGLSLTFTLDEKSLEANYYDLSKRLHPDRFAAGGMAAKMKSQELAAVLNQAYLSLRQPESRLEGLLRLSGALQENDRSTNQIPTDLAEEYFELQEAVTENPEHAVNLARSLRERLESQKQELSSKMYAEASKIDWPQAAQGLKTSAVEKIAEIRRQRSYVRSMLDNLERLGVRHV